jgi:hypothetical protein
MEVFALRYVYALLGLAVLLSATLATAGNFKVQMDVATFVDAANPDNDSSSNDTLWSASADGQPEMVTYLSFVNKFGTIGVFNPDQVRSASLKLDVSKVVKPGRINAYFVHGETSEIATWNEKPEYNSSVSAALDVQNAGEYTIDVKPIIVEAIRSCTEGCGYSIALVADDNVSVGFSKEDALKPQLEFSTND